MHPRDCPNWEYDHIPGARDVVRVRAIELLIRIHGDQDACAVATCETRTSHEELFNGLTPPACTYFAGHFRGEDFRCLRNLQVGIREDPMVGHQAADVAGAMSDLEGLLRQAIVVLDQFFQAGRSRPAGLIQIVRVAARVFVSFLTIHPYANGNGHAARLMVCALLGRYGFWPGHWTIEPRPRDPPYSAAIADYRRGNIADLERFLLECVKWGSPPVSPTTPGAPAAPVAPVTPTVPGTQP